MAAKRGKRVGTKKRETTPGKSTGKAATRPTTGERRAEWAAGARGRRATTPEAAPPRPAASPRPGPSSLLERATRLRDSIAQSKLTALNPWSYSTKTRPWSQRAQGLVDAIAGGGDRGELERQLAALAAEVEGDRDFQEARRRT